MYTVIWRTIAENQLAQIWVDHPGFRGRLTDLTERIDHRLRFDPTTQGEGRGGATRLLILDGLVVFFEIVQDDLRVEVLRVQVL